ncbi:MAG: response regulator [Chitinophagales bacterium]|nr:response regulator [Chitinophagales bacterium]
MRKYSVLIADDEKLSREAVKLQLQVSNGFDIVAECKNGREALMQIVQLKPDIIFLDIQMPYLNGLEVLDKLEDEYFPVIIIISAYDNYALKAFESDAIDYLVKPFTDERFKKSLDKAKRLCKDASHQFKPTNSSIAQLTEMIKRVFYDEQEIVLSIKDNAKISVVQSSDILYIESAGNYVSVFIHGKKFLHKETLQSLEDRLPTSFLRIHKSVIVNSTYITELHSLYNGDYIIKLKTGQELRLSRNYRKNIQHLLQ